MFAQLGYVRFKDLKTFDEFSESSSANFAEHNLLDSKPRLQFTGTSLKELSISIRLHASFCNPQQEKESLDAFKEQGTVLPLLWGNGLLEGNFVITELSSTKEDILPEGTVTCYMIQLSLKEFIVPNQLQQQQADNRDKAKAVGDKKAVVKKKANPLTCEKIISNDVTKIENHASLINKILLEKGGAEAYENKSKIISSLNAIRVLCQDIMTRCDDANSCAYQDANLKSWANLVKSQTSFMENSVNINPAQANNDNNVLQSRVKSLKAAAKKYINKSITRS